MFFIIFWLLLSILVGVFAHSKKRSGFAWFLLSLIISPLIAFIIILVAGPPASALKKCPKCAEFVKTEAIICRFCQYEFPQEQVKKEVREPIKIGEKITQETIDQLWKQKEEILGKK